MLGAPAFPYQQIAMVTHSEQRSASRNVSVLQHAPLLANFWQPAVTSGRGESGDNDPAQRVPAGGGAAIQPLARVLKG